MNPKSMLIGLVPWVLFSVLVQRVGADTAGIAALLAAAVSAALIVHGRASGIKVINVAGVVTFLVLAVLAFAGGHAMRQDVADYGRGASTLVLALVMLGSVLVIPFTEQYARASVPREYWTSPVFRAVNRRLSLVWGITVLATAAAHLWAGRLRADGHGSLATNLLLNWAVPIVMVLGAALITKRAAGAAARTRAAQPETNPA